MREKIGREVGKGAKGMPVRLAISVTRRRGPEHAGCQPHLERCNSVFSVAFLWARKKAKGHDGPRYGGAGSTAERIQAKPRRTCHTPTVALAMRMKRMTNGSTKAVNCSSLSSSKKASPCPGEPTAWAGCLPSVLPVRGPSGRSEPRAYKGDDGGGHQNLDQEVVKLLQNQGEEGLS